MPLARPGRHRFLSVSAVSDSRIGGFRLTLEGVSPLTRADGGVQLDAAGGDGGRGGRGGRGGIGGRGGRGDGGAVGGCAGGICGFRGREAQAMLMEEALRDDA